MGGIVLANGDFELVQIHVALLNNEINQVRSPEDPVTPLMQGEFWWRHGPHLSCSQEVPYRLRLLATASDRTRISSAIASTASRTRLTDRLWEHVHSMPITNSSGHLQFFPSRWGCLQELTSCPMGWLCPRSPRSQRGRCRRGRAPSAPHVLECCGRKLDLKSAGQQACTMFFQPELLIVRRCPWGTGPRGLLLKLYEEIVVVVHFASVEEEDGHDTTDPRSQGPIAVWEWMLQQFYKLRALVCLMHPTKTTSERSAE